MFSFNNLTFRSKIVGSFVILILLTAVLVASSVYKISSTREITIDKIENLNEKGSGLLLQFTLSGQKNCH